MAGLKGVTLLITHYNRSSSLERLLKSLKDLGIEFESIVVSDDGSDVEHLHNIEVLRSTFKFRLVTSPHNKGLGHNLNKGQDAVLTPLTLYIQEDFVPTLKFAEKLPQALLIMSERADLDMIRFYAYTLYPNLKEFKEGFFEMIFNIWSPGYTKFYLYSDHPHLRRSDFLKKFGRYREGLKVERTEYFMMISFLKHKGKALFYGEFSSLFTQSNSIEEPSTVSRNFWRENGSIFVTLLRHFYRHVRFNFDLLFYKD